MRKPAFSHMRKQKAQIRCTVTVQLISAFVFVSYINSTIPLFPRYDFSSLCPSFVAVQTGLCRTWSGTSKSGLLTTRLKYKSLQCSKTAYYTISTLSYTPLQGPIILPSKMGVGVLCLINS